ncbi:hypothetical protein [Puerhibacterium puerhi]|uniref:hypothetical protein n=1 Tax=Puerhibacterium puerhi TaxID=2692623 RepID=UPI00135C35B8|nr:hypothetical protein [Puerhibacterium puerhi]
MPESREFRRLATDITTIKRRLAAVENSPRLAWSSLQIPTGESADGSSEDFLDITVPDLYDAARGAGDIAEQVASELTEAREELDREMGELANNLGDLAVDLDELENTTLPNLRTDLTNLDTQLNEARTELNNEMGQLNTQLGGLNTRLDKAETAITTTLPDSIERAQEAADLAEKLLTSSTAAPTKADGAGRPVGAVWEQRNASGARTAAWRWDGTDWQPYGLDPTIIPNLAASKITSGTIATARLDAEEVAGAVGTFLDLRADQITAIGAGFQTAVAENLWAKKIAAGKVLADEVVIGSGANLLAEPDFAQGGQGWVNAGAASYTTVQDGPDGAPTPVMRFAPTTNDYSVPNAAWPTSGDTPQVEGGKRFRFVMRARVVSGSTGRLRLRAGLFRDGASNAWPLLTNELDASTATRGQWVTLTSDGLSGGSFAMYTNRDRMSVSVHASGAAGTVFEVAFVAMYAMSDASLIVDGAVGARQVNAQEVAGAVGSFVKLNADQITAVGAGFNTAVAENLWAKKIAAGRVLASEVIIGSGPNMIPWDPAAGVEPHGGWSGSTVQAFKDSDVGWCIKADGGNTTDGNFGYAIRLGSGYTARNGREQAFDVEPGASYRLRVGVGIAGSMPSGVTRQVRWVVATQGQDAGTTLEYLNSDPIAANAFGADIPYLDFIFTPKPGVVSISVYLQKTWFSSGSLLVVNPTLTNAADSSLIVDGAITADKLKSNAVTTDKLAANAVTADKIEANAVTAGKIAANAITADKIAANALNGKVITGAIVQTASSATRMVLSNASNDITRPGIWLYDSNDVYRWTTQISTAGLPIQVYRDAKDVRRLQLWEGGMLIYDEKGVQRGSYTAQSLSISSPLDKMMFRVSPEVSSGETIMEFFGADTGNRLGHILRTPGDPGLQIYGGNDNRGWGLLEVMATTDGPRVRSRSVYLRTTSAGANVYISSDYTLARSTSLKQYKYDVQDVEPNTRLLHMPVRSWLDKQAAIDARMRGDDLPTTRQVGVVVEEVQDIAPELVTRDVDGKPNGFAYDRLAAELILVLRDLTNRIEVLEGKEPTAWQPSPVYDKFADDDIISEIYGYDPEESEEPNG